MFMPFQVLGMFLRGLLALALLGFGILLFAQWYGPREHIIVERVPDVRLIPRDAEERQAAEPEAAPVATTRVRVIRWEFGLNRETAYLLGGLALLGWSIGGGLLFSPLLWRRGGKDDPLQEHSHKTEKLHRPDGSDLCIASYGPIDADPVVFVHGWGLDSNEWVYAKRELGGYRLITWDLPGLGKSTRPTDRDWSLQKLAQHLDAVIGAAGNKPVALVGHSIGVMIILTYCKLFPEALGTRVHRLVLAHGTYTNPVKTTSKASLYTALQKPVLEPLCHLMVWLAPLVQALNWLSYVNGSAHRSTERDSFSGKETRGQLDFLTRYYCKAPPDVVGRGMLAMFEYDATSALKRITIPTLVVAGDQDATCTPEASHHMAAEIPGAELVALSEAKHCGLFEHHEQFHEALVDFLGAEAPPVVQGQRRPGPASLGASKAES